MGISPIDDHRQTTCATAAITALRALILPAVVACWPLFAPAQILTMVDSIRLNHADIWGVTFDGGGDKRFSYTVRDVLGRKMAAGEAPAGKVTLDVSSLPPGVYVVEIVAAGKPSTRRLKIVKR